MEQKRENDSLNPKSLYSWGLYGGFGQDGIERACRHCVTWGILCLRSEPV